eukprot:9434403-Alexandrium_andersonii.AAC.1
MRRRMTSSKPYATARLPCTRTSTREGTRERRTMQFRTLARCLATQSCATTMTSSAASCLTPRQRLTARATAWSPQSA